jgi:hypothetical protein
VKPLAASRRWFCYHDAIAVEECVMFSETPQPDAQERAADPASPETEPTAWEQIEPGRFMPRRVRGSFRGRVLG